MRKAGEGVPPAHVNSTPFVAHDGKTFVEVSIKTFNEHRVVVVAG